MQLLSDATKPAVRAEFCAKQMMDVVPWVMQFMRRQMRKHRTHDLTIPQLRTLYFLSIHERPSLSDAADFIGLSLPAMSRLVEALVKKGLATRTVCPQDRRHVRLGITPEGHAAFKVAWQGTHARLSEEVQSFRPEDRETITAAMEILRGSFDPDVVRG